MSILLYIIEFTINVLPYKLSLKIGAGVGTILFWIDKRHRLLAISNIKRTLIVSSKEARIIAVKSFQNFGINIIDFFRRDILEKANIEIVGKEYIKRDRGNIFVLGHFGNWELMGRIAIKDGLQIAAVGRAIKNRGVDKYIKKRRTFAGLEILEKKGSFKRLLSALKEGVSAAILIDQYAGRRGVFVDFLGLNTSTVGSPALLVLKTDCPIIPVFIIREGKATKIFIEPPVPIVKTGNVSEDIISNTQAMVKPLEKYVRKYPEQWWWVHRRWRDK